MCGFREVQLPEAKKTLDKLISPTSIWAVNARMSQMGRDTVFRIRTQLGLTQLEFAQLLKVTPITVSRWERGATKVSIAYASLITTASEQFREERQQQKVAR